jgi:hypothetical protein
MYTVFHHLAAHQCFKSAVNGSGLGWLQQAFGGNSMILSFLLSHKSFGPFYSLVYVSTRLRNHTPVNNIYLLEKFVTFMKRIAVCGRTEQNRTLYYTKKKSILLKAKYVDVFVIMANYKIIPENLLCFIKFHY